MRRGFIVAGWLVLACASGTPAPKTEPATAHPSAAAAAFPPTGPVELRPRNPPAEGTLVQLLMSYQGRSEVSDDRPGASDESSQTIEERTSFELDYRQLPVGAPAGDLASSLVLEALKRRTMMMPPGAEHVIEIGDDRLRVMTNDKVDTDLQGAQPKEDLTPRTLLGKTFALLVTDARGNSKGVSVRGLPAAKKMLAALPLRESVSYAQIAYPEGPVSPGDTWRAKRFLPNPIGKVGLALDLEYRLTGFEKLGDVGCARAMIRGQVDAKDVKSESGFTFDEVRYTVAGDAWYDLATGQIEAARIEDVTAVSYRKTAISAHARVRMRYEGRTQVKRLTELPGPLTWADGTKRFSAVK